MRARGKRAKRFSHITGNHTGCFVQIITTWFGEKLKY